MILVLLLSMFGPPQGRICPFLFSVLSVLVLPGIYYLNIYTYFGLRGGGGGGREVKRNVFLTPSIPMMVLISNSNSGHVKHV